MSDEKALLAAIWAHPDEDTPRLMYADWLQENGQPERAEFIRAQCEVERLPPSDPRYAVLKLRAAKLLSGRRRLWSLPLKGWQDMWFSRGFPLPYLPVTAVRDVIRLGADDLRGAPLWRHRDGATADDFDALLGWSQLHRLTTFTLRIPAPEGWCARLVACAGLRNVTDLAFSYVPIPPSGLKAVLDAWSGRRLSTLSVNNCSFGDAGAEVLANHPVAAGLRALWAYSTGLTARGIEAIVNSPYLENLTEVTFVRNQLGDTAGEHLLRWKALDHIRKLCLMDTGLTKGVQTKLRRRLGDRVRV